jgi:hypothetical protein
MQAFPNMMWYQTTVWLHDNWQVRSACTIAYSLRSSDFVSVIQNVEARYLVTPLSSISTWSNLAASRKWSKDSKLHVKCFWLLVLLLQELLYVLKKMSTPATKKLRMITHETYAMDSTITITSWPSALRCGAITGDGFTVYSRLCFSP